MRILKAQIEQETQDRDEKADTKAKKLQAKAVSECDIQAVCFQLWPCASLMIMLRQSRR